MHWGGLNVKHNIVIITQEEPASFIQLIIKIFVVFLGFIRRRKAAFLTRAPVIISDQWWNGI